MNQQTERLMKNLKGMQSAVVGFSGGIDSTLVLNTALSVLGRENVLAVVANSELFSDDEFNAAVKLAQSMGANVETTTIDYLSEPHVKHNTSDSWYYAKQLFYQRLELIRQQHDFHVVLDGMIMDDLNDYRPGMKARDEAGAKSPLEMAGFYKTDVRNLAHEQGLTNWSKVPSCSIASRFPYNTTLTSAMLTRVLKAEKYLRTQGFPVVRVRSTGETARIEVPSDQIDDLMVQREAVNHELKALGFDFVSIDLGGFVSGHMNSQLSAAQLAQFA
ncbi:ATP-dependent sacrificial sulfur transferase LarE [Lactiplantibacillus daowaiensis]|uniref:ATP-dependent sacrificial sulfur transferase LarE n=1 Tax=Lactiplantibacillus daowaiensis TaxID=2559918 RepID=A0ABW1RWA0_9LACO|nr:ATP-dependent sacrificial sulfur transferase LarE [Lactiplantibacillus daowaiensis]